MDPFEELTIASRSASQPGRTPATGSPAVQQRLPGRDVASQPAAVGTRQGNPFLDQSEQASANALTVPQPRANAFGDLLPTEFVRNSKTNNASPMKVSPLPDMFRPLSQGMQSQALQNPVGSNMQGWSAFDDSPQQLPSSLPTSSPVAVDGISQSQVNKLFQDADRDQDGRLIGAEARNFFKMASLPDDTLFRIWEKAKVAAPASGEGLTRGQFSVALRLIALAQSGWVLTDETLSQAASSESWLSSGQMPLAAPTLQSSNQQSSAASAPRGVGQQQQQQQQTTSWNSFQLKPEAQSYVVPQQSQSQMPPSISDAFSAPQPRTQDSAQPQRPQSQSLLDVFGLQSSPPAYTQSQRPQLPSGFGSYAQSQPPTQASPQPQQAQISLLDDHLLPPNHSHQKLQHTQSFPKAPLYPNQKASAAKRLSDIPQAAIPLSATAQSVQQSLYPSQSPTQIQTALDTLGSNPSDMVSPAPILPLSANPFAASSFGDLSLTHPSAPVLRTQRADATPSGSPSSSPTKADGRSQQQHDAPLAFDARLSPLHPKLSAPLTLLAAAHGSLFAGPSFHGGLLQWARPEGNMRPPSGASPAVENSRAELSSGAVLANAEEGNWADRHEDSDAAGSMEIPMYDCKKLTCIHADEAAGLLWTGHNDGKVCVFALDKKPGVSIAGQLLNSWPAHKIGSVTNILTTPKGELWTGSSRGIIRLWHGAHKMGGEQQKPVRELRRPGGGKPHGEVRSMVLEASGQVVWTGGDKSMALWCAFSGAFLGSVDRGRELGLPESASFRQDLARPSTFQEEWRSKVDCSQGLELDSNARVTSRPQGYAIQQCREEQEGWGQSSDKATRAFMENLAVRGGQAANHAGKAAKYIGKLGFKLARNFALEDAKPLANGKPVDEDAQSFSGDRKVANHIRAMVAANDGCVWVAFKAGRIERYKFNGKLISSKDIGVGIAAMAAVGLNIWVGQVDGRIRVYKDGGSRAQHEWQGHDAGIIAIVPCGSRAFSLAADGSLKGWSSLTPSPLDANIRALYDADSHAVVTKESLEMLCLTWNVNEQRPDPSSSLFQWVADLSAKASIVTVALQEIEMGGGSVAIAAAKDVLNKSAQEKGNNNAQWWQTQMIYTLGQDRWMRVGLRQLSGMLIMVFARASLSEHIGGISTASVACGVLGVGGNKGGVAVSFTLYRRRLCCVCSHFAAHQGAVEARNRDYAAIVRSLNFVQKGWYDTQIQADEEAEIRRKEVARLAENDSGMDSPRADSELDLGVSDFSTPELLQGQGMRDAEMLVWAGDFNYRIEASYTDALHHIAQNELDWLLEREQCRREMFAGRVFRYIREAPITFHPTYKFDKHTSTYDTSEKQRVPAWTDRIFFRGSAFIKNVPESQEDLLSSDAGSEEPALQPPEPQAPVDEVVVRALRYNACKDVLDSDHKPVWAILALDVPVTDQQKKRRMCSHILKHSLAQETAAAGKPALQMSCETVRLSQERGSHGTVTLSNAGTQAAHFCLVAQSSRQWWDQPSGQDTGLPDWLDVFPISGVVPPQGSATVCLTMVTDENVYTSQAYEAHLAVKVGTVLEAGAEQQLKGNDGFLQLFVTTFQAHGGGHHFEF